MDEETGGGKTSRGLIVLDEKVITWTNAARTAAFVPIGESSRWRRGPLRSGSWA